MLEHPMVYKDTIKEKLFKTFSKEALHYLRLSSQVRESKVPYCNSNAEKFLFLSEQLLSLVSSSIDNLLDKIVSHMQKPRTRTYNILFPLVTMKTIYPKSYRVRRLTYHLTVSVTKRASVSSRIRPRIGNIFHCEVHMMNGEPLLQFSETLQPYRGT